MSQPTLGKILTVDDSYTNLKLIANYVSDLGYEVITASSGNQGLQMAIAKRPHLILLDIKLPDMSGFDVCEKLRMNPLLSQTPVIFLTASNEMDSINQAFEAGGNDYITKPINLNKLRTCIETNMELVQVKHESYS